jgi:hypothetical protein
LGTGLTKADLATGNFALIQDKLTKLFAGQAAAAAETYAGKINRLKVAFDNMKESVGFGLVSAFENLSGPQGSIAKTTTMIENLGYAISAEISGIGMAFAFAAGVLNKLWDNPVGRFIQRFNIVKNTFNDLVDAGKFAAWEAKIKANTKALEQSYAAAKKNKELADKQLALDKAALALKQASKVIDMDQIQLFAAMAQAKGNDLDRLKLQQALLDGNATAVTKLADKVLAANGLMMDLQGNIKADPFAQWLNSLQAAEDNLKRMLAIAQSIKINTGGAAGAAGADASSMPAFTPLTQSTINSIAGGGDVGFALAAAAFQNAMPATEVKVTVDPSAMAYGISLANQNQSSNGTQTTLSRNNPGYFIPQS